MQLPPEHGWVTLHQLAENDYLITEKADLCLLKKARFLSDPDPCQQSIFGRVLRVGFGVCFCRQGSSLYRFVHRVSNMLQICPYINTQYSCLQKPARNSG
jgi:hypothetical protein